MKTEMQEGVEEANVVLYGILPNGVPAPVFSDLTDNSGNFMFADLLPGRKKVGKLRVVDVVEERRVRHDEIEALARQARERRIAA